MRIPLVVSLSNHAGSVVNNSPQESWNKQNWKEDVYQEIAIKVSTRLPEES
jgi:hypothetical protein